MLRALWISGYNLGLIENPDDRALLAFVEKQTQISHTRFLTDPMEGRKAIEALKSWLTRGGVKYWPTAADAKREGRHTQSWLAKREVVYAIAAKIIELEPTFDQHGFVFGVYAGQTNLGAQSEQFLDNCARQLGQHLRRLKGKTAKREAA